MKYYFFSLLILLTLGCNLIDVHPYAVKLKGETDINAKNIEIIESSCKEKQTIRFVTMGDSQRWYDETKDFVEHLNSRNDIDFVIHGGDMTDFGVADEFVWQRDIMNGLKVPYVVVLGNHDCLGTGEQTYKKLFGEENFSFIAGRVKFVCLNTNAIEYDYSRPIPDFYFMEREMSERSEEFEKSVIVMHARPLAEQFNNNVARVFHRYATEYPNLQFCTAAHDHRVTAEDIFKDGVMYYGSDCMKRRSYLLFTIKPEGYDYEVVYY